MYENSLKNNFGASSSIEDYYKSMALKQSDTFYFHMKLINKSWCCETEKFA